MVAAGLAPAASAQEVIRMQVAAGHPAIFLWVKHVNESLMATVDAELKKTGASTNNLKKNINNA